MILNLLLLFCCLPMFAQEKPSSRAIREATEAERVRYNLSADQVAEMADIQNQRLTNLAAIEALKDQDYSVYLSKKRALRHYVEMATERLLTPAQRPILDQLREERAAQLSALRIRLKQEGADPAAIDRALLEWEENRQ